MEVYQCLTCGERWGHGSQAAERRAQQHGMSSHRVLIGEDRVLRAMAAAAGLVVVEPPDEPVMLYRCLTCDCSWIHTGMEEAYQRSMEHGAQGHRVVIGPEALVGAMMLGAYQPAVQEPDPTVG